MFRWFLFVALGVACCATAVLAARERVMLPSGWRIEPPSGPMARTGTMPQGIALSPDATQLAVVESGVNPATLRVLDARTLGERRAIVLAGAFGKPVWREASHVLVAGANADAIFDVNVADGSVATTSVAKGAWPDSVALSPDRALVAVANDGDGTVDIGPSCFGCAQHDTLTAAASVTVGAHPGDVLFSADGNTVYVALRGDSDVAVIRQGRVAHRIRVGLHPSALARSPDGSKLYVALADDDALATVDLRSQHVIARTSVRLRNMRASQYGASPNALTLDARGNVYVSCGALNAIAVVTADGRGAYDRDLPAGWYPTGVAVSTDGETLYVSNGKGEGAPANPQFDPFVQNSPGYIGSITVGSVRKIDARAPFLHRHTLDSALANVLPQWQAPGAGSTVLRAQGPIAHVIYIIKENRSYDQVLGDVPGANGDPRLVQFGARITPNQHALARRFGVFDNAYANSQVSADGHNWTDAGFANDYVERFWPPSYGNRRELYDFQSGGQPDVPHNGYLWDDALRAHVSFRDYGEDINYDAKTHTNTTTHPGLQGRFDPAFVGWNLAISDQSRFEAWRTEFERFVAARALPQLEIVYFPNDHTAATVPGRPTPQAYVALNDYAVGELVEAVSRSPYWKSTAIFALEDDAQNGPDHVSDQRSTFYIASPYARGGVHHAHYSTAGIVHTIELLLGMPALSIYDQTAAPLYDAFGMRADLRPFVALPPRIDVRAVNARTAYGATRSLRLDFSHPDAAEGAALDDILAHAAARR